MEEPESLSLNFQGIPYLSMDISLNEIEKAVMISRHERRPENTTTLLCILDRKQTQIKHKQADLRGFPKPGTSTEATDCILLEE
jgi:hypothetical protein